MEPCGLIISEAYTKQTKITEYISNNNKVADVSGNN